jgi:hypothetical protein
VSSASCRTCSALGALSSLPALASGVSIPAGTLSPLATVLQTIGAQSGVPAAATSLLDTIATQLSGAITPSTLLGMIKDLDTVGDLLPPPLNGVVDDLVSQLAGAGSLVGETTGTGAGTTPGTGTGTSGVTTSAPTTAEIDAYLAYLTKEKAAVAAAAKAKTAAAKGGYLAISKVRQNGRTLIVTVRCAGGAASKPCRANVFANEHSRRLATKSVTVKGTKSAQVKLKLPEAATVASAHAKREKVTVTAKTGSKKTSKVMRLLLSR